jgi:peptidoglycan/LPS O-acetylase OafA/YrhL
MRHACVLVALFVSVCGWAQTSPTTSPTSIKSDGNFLLKNCTAAVLYIDSGFTETTNKFVAGWCLGYEEHVYLFPKWSHGGAGG